MSRVSEWVGRLAERGAGGRSVGEGLSRWRLRLGGSTATMLCRDGTLDARIARQIVCRHSEYRLPDCVRPGVIFDVGANIGSASVYLALRYPEARVYAFEPLPENVALLRRNVACFGGRVTVLPFGLSDRDGEFAYFMSDDSANLGGGGFVSGPGNRPTSEVRLPLREVGAVMRELGVEWADVWKIDTEGSEHAILRAIPAAVLARAQAVIGELHGREDWAACELLSRLHRLGVDKKPSNRCFHFLALRPDLVGGGAAAAAA